MSMKKYVIYISLMKAISIWRKLWKKRRGKWNESSQKWCEEKMKKVFRREISINRSLLRKSQRNTRSIWNLKEAASSLLRTVSIYEMTHSAGCRNVQCSTMQIEKAHGCGYREATEVLLRSLWPFYSRERNVSNKHYLTNGYKRMPVRLPWLNTFMPEEKYISILSSC